LSFQQSLLAKPDEVEDEKPENEGIRKLIEEMKKAGQVNRFGQSRVDINGDGRKDLIVWQLIGDIDPRTDVYVFLRGADGKLPERATQLVHGRGIPIPVGSTDQPSPIADLKGDGTYELVLFELKISFTSASGLVDIALSHGLDWMLTIRSFRHGAFSSIPDASIPVTTMIPIAELEQWPFFICGDFNGDGRPDFVIRRSATQWTVYFSTRDWRWFAPQPAMTFETPMQGNFTIRDLNGDGRSDIILRAWKDPRIFIFLTQSQPKHL
jgi:hypothetical protein